MSNPYRPDLNNPPPSQFPTGAPQQTNGLGTAGFVVSLIGLFTCGALSIIGLGLSLFGLRKNPKGLAIAGVIMGLIGLVVLAITTVAVYRAVQMAGNLQTLLAEGISRSIAQNIASDVAEEWESTGQLPSDADGQSFINGKRGVLGDAFRYETDGSSFSIRASGPDLEFDTADDMVVGPFDSAQKVFDLLAEDDIDDPAEDSDFQSDWEIEDQ